MAVRWTITFKTVNDRTGLVKVYDSSYSGDPIALEPAVNAFSTTRQQQDLFQPIIADSGYLRVVDNGNVVDSVEDLHPLAAMDRPVEFYLDNVLKWRGYISPESFTMDWSPAPRVVELPLVGALSILDNINIEDNGVSLQSVAAFVKECLEATGFTWSKVVLVNQMTTLTDNVDSYNVPELRLSLSRFNYFRKNNVANSDSGLSWITGLSYKEVLESICRYFCWTAYQDGDVLYLSSPRTDLDNYPHDVEWAALSAIALDPKATSAGIYNHSTKRPSQALSSLEWDGINHRKSIRNGARKVQVNTNMGFYSEYFPSIKFSGKKLVEYPGGFYKGIPGVTSGNIQFRSITKILAIESENIIIRNYELEYDGSTVIGAHVVPWSPPEGENYRARVGADIIKFFQYQYPAGSADPHPVQVFRPLIRICRHEYKEGSYYKIPKDYPILTIKSYGGNNLALDGAIVISGDINLNIIYSTPFTSPVALASDDGKVLYGPFVNNLRVILKVGDLYYNGTEWTDTETIFSIPVVGDPSSPAVQGTAHIKNTNNGEYENVSGYCIPISGYLSGPMEFTICSWENGSAGYPWEQNAANIIFISGLNIKYVNNNTDYSDGLTLNSQTGVAFQDEKSVDLSLSSAPETKAGNGLLFWDGAPIGQQDIFSYAVSTEAGTASQPEYWLLDSLKKVYSKPSTWLELQTGLDAAISMWNLITYSGKTYMVTCCETDYADEHTKLIIASYE